MRPSFTVAIPTHDRRETVVLAVRSVLAQTGGARVEEVLVLCDGCTDGTQEALAALGDPRVVVVDLPKGPGYAYDHRNRALERARGEAIVYLGDDDLMLPEHLASIASVWADDVDVVGTPAAVVAPDDGLSWAGADWRVPAVRELMLGVENTNVMGSVAIRVEVARRVGGWDGALERGGDWDLWWRALDGGARPAATATPTLLHFRATGRVQEWESRVEQNRRWLAALEDPGSLASLRARLSKLHLDGAAALWNRIAIERARTAEAITSRDAALAHAAAVEEDRALIAAELERIRTDRDLIAADRDALAAQLAARP